MRGTGLVELILPLLAAITLAFPSFSILISANNLPGLLTLASDLDFEISGLRAPLDIEYAASKYSDEKDYLYLDNLKSAWNNAADARKLAEDMLKISKNAKLSIVDNKSFLEIDVDIHSKEERARQALLSALKDAYNVLDGLINLLDSDRTQMDLIGADNHMFVKSHVFLELDRFMDGINSEIGHYNFLTRIEANPCSLDGLKYRTICVIRKMSYLEKPTTSDAVSIFNEIVGYPWDSLINHYYEYHQNTTRLIREMFFDYSAALDAFDTKFSDLSAKLSALEKEKIYLVDQSVSNLITKNLAAQVNLSAGHGESLSESFTKFSAETENLKHKKAIIEKEFGEKLDDYLFLSTDALKSLNALQDELAGYSDTLGRNFVELHEKSKKAYAEALEINAEKKTTSLFLSALDIGRKAESAKTLGESIKEYSRAISLLAFINSANVASLSVDTSLEYLKNTLSALGNFGIDVNYEKEQYTRLKGITENTLLDEVYFDADVLISKLSEKAGFAVSKIYSLRQTLAGYFADYSIFLQNPELAEKLDSKKIDELEKAFLSSLTHEILPNTDKLYAQYYDTERYLRTQFSSVASDYLLDFMGYTYEFVGEPVCKNYSRATVLLFVRNPTSIALSDLKLSKKIDIKSDLKDALDLYIDAILPGEIKYREYPANIWHNCSNSTAGNVSIEKIFFDMNSRIVQYCLIADCADLQKAYNKAYSDSDPLLIEGEFSKHASNFLNEFTGSSTRKTLENVNLLLKSFKKAVDLGSVDGNATLLFSQNDYLQAESKYKSLANLHSFVSPTSFSGKNPVEQFDELVKKFSPVDIIDFVDNLQSLENYLNGSLESMRTDAKADLLDAKQRYDEVGEGADKLKQALDSYNSGKYNQAILFASIVPAQKLQGTDFSSAAYLALAAVLIFFCAFLIRKPKKEKKFVRRLLRATP